MITLDDYEPIVGTARIRAIKNLARGLEGFRLLTVNSTREGGGVAEILQRLVPLLNEIGVETEWAVIEGTGEFFKTTKKMHNTLQGLPGEFSEEELEEYRKVNEINAGRIDFKRDMVLIHDPQPAALIAYADKSCPWVWRCHIDLSHPNRRIWRFLKDYVGMYDASVFTLNSFSQALEHPQYLICPSIDPLSDKNRDLTNEEIEDVLENFRIPKDKPLVLQVSRFDIFKDPLGVIDAFNLVRKQTPCRLILAGAPASDDPESMEVLNKVLEKVGDDGNIHIVQLDPLDKISVNALQRISDIVIQKSTREGFGLTVTEALWKRKPVVGGAAGGILVQIYDGFNGYVVHSVEGCAYWTRFLLARDDLRETLGENGHRFVRNEYLITRHLLDYLMLIRKVTGRY